MDWDFRQFARYTFVGRFKSMRMVWDGPDYWRVEFRTYYRNGHAVEIVTDTLGLDGVE